jgi:hypothetical protein
MQFYIYNNQLRIYRKEMHFRNTVTLPVLFYCHSFQLTYSIHHCQKFLKEKYTKQQNIHIEAHDENWYSCKCIHFNKTKTILYTEHKP